MFRDYLTALFPSFWESKKIEISYVEGKCSLAAMTNDGLTITKGGKYARVVELYGKDYTGLDIGTMKALFNTRLEWFNSLPTNLTVLHHSHRVKQAVSVDISDFANPISADIAKTHYEIFSETFRSKHYLVFSNSLNNMMDRAAWTAKKVIGLADAEERELLQDCVDKCIETFRDYGAKEVKGDDLASFWASLLSGYQVRQKAPQDGDLTEVLARSYLRWPAWKNHQVYISPYGEKYSGWLYIKIPAKISNEDLFNSLFQVEEVFSIYQTFTRLEKGKAQGRLKDRERNVQGEMEAGEIHADEIADARTRLTGDDLNDLLHTHSLEVIADSLEELKKSINRILKVVEAHNYGAIRDHFLACEPKFWSRFPGMLEYDPRVRELTSENAADFATFASVGEGHTSCTWGPHPLTHVKTISGSEYGLILHETPKVGESGNTAIIGGNGTGKSVLASFLMSQGFRFPDFRVVAFDQLHGLEVMTNYHDGHYISTEDIDSLQMNPLQMPDTGENRTFLEHWFQLLTKMEKNDQKGETLIAQAVAKNYTLEPKEQMLEELSLAFGLKDEKIRSALDKWLPGKAKGQYFNSPKDKLSLDDKRLLTFDMTKLLGDPDALAPISSYLTHRITSAAAQGQWPGYMIFFDELPRFADDPNISPLIEILLQQVRKTDGIIMTACQDAPTILDHHLAPRFLTNIATWFLFPDPRARPEHYIDMLHLNETEFKWIRNSSPTCRKVLKKSRNGESVILDVNLAHLGKKLKIFDSSIKAVLHHRKLMELYGNAWKHHYLYD